MKKLISILFGRPEVGITVLRVVMGLMMVYHGWFRIYYTNWSIWFFDFLGIPFSVVLGPLITLLELVGGVALVAGLFTRILGKLFILDFLLTIWAQFFGLNRGYSGAEKEVLFLVCAYLLATNGPGAYALGQSKFSSETKN